MAEQGKERLVDFLDERAFTPVIRADPGDFPEGKRDRLRDVQRATEQERERYRGYDSAEQVYEMYRDDLNSDAAREVNRKLDELGLPTLGQVQDEFERLAEQVGAKH